MDWFEVFWQGVVNALGIYAGVFERDPWPWLAIAGFFAVPIALSAMTSRARRPRRR